ncbi:hypothetical protein KQH54_00635 [bacterium]|nr:hypothetical protein [bacterium]
MTKSNPDNIGKRAVLAELQRNFDKSYNSIDILDGKLQNVLGFSSLVISLLGFINIENLQKNLVCWFPLWFTIMGLLYFGILFSIFRALRPRDYANPISKDWTELDKRYFNEEEGIVLDRLNSDYLKFIEDINIIAKEKAKALNYSLFLFSFIVILIFLSIPLSL